MLRRKNISRHPPLQYCKACDSDIQKSFHCHSGWCIGQCPIHQWHELVTQIVLSLNLLWQLHVVPNTLAYAYHHGSFDYNHMLLAPMGCTVQFHIKSNQQGKHASDGWYLRTSPDHTDSTGSLSKPPEQNVLPTPFSSSTSTSHNQH